MTQRDIVKPQIVETTEGTLRPEHVDDLSFVIETLKSGDSILWDSLSSEFREMAIK